MQQHQIAAPSIMDDDEIEIADECDDIIEGSRRVAHRAPLLLLR